MTKDCMISKNSKNVFRIFGGSSTSSDAVHKTVVTNSKIISSPIPAQKTLQPSFAPILYHTNVLKPISNKNLLQKELLIPNGKNVATLENPAQPKGLSIILDDEFKFNVDVSHIVNIDSYREERVDGKLREEALMDILSLHQAFYNMNSITFAKSVCLLDTFMNKIKFKPKYIMCVTAASYYIASKFENSSDAFYPTRDNLIRIYRCPGTKEDLTRMIDIILEKLTPEFIASLGASNSTAINFLELFFNHINLMNDKTAKVYDPVFKSLSRKLELMLCSPCMTKYRPSCQALSLLYGSCTEDVHLDKIDNLTLLDVLNFACACQVDWSEIEECFANFKLILQKHSKTNSSSSSATIDNQFFSNTSPESNLLCSNYAGSPPIRWSLSKRTRLSMSKFALVKPKLNTIIERQKEEIELNQEYERQKLENLQSKQSSSTITEAIEIIEEANISQDSENTNKNCIIDNNHNTTNLVTVTDNQHQQSSPLPQQEQHQKMLPALSQKIESITDEKPKSDKSILRSTKFKIHSNNTKKRPSLTSLDGLTSSTTTPGLQQSLIANNPNSNSSTSSLLVLATSVQQPIHQMATENFFPFNTPFPTNYNQFYDEINDSICGLLTPLLIA